MWGYSAGAAVTQWAAELQQSYAPDLKIAGAVLGGGCNSIVTPISKVNNERVAGFLPTFMIGLSAQYPEAREVIDKHLKSEHREEFYKPLHMCLDATIGFFAGKDITAMFNDWPGLVGSPILLKALDASGQGKSISKIPLFWHTATHDEAEPIEEMDAIAAKYCAESGTVQYRRDTAPNLCHTNYGFIGAPVALAWLKEVLDGKDPKPGCSVENGDTSEIDPGFLKIFPKVLADSLVASARRIGGGV